LRSSDSSNDFGIRQTDEKKAAAAAAAAAAEATTAAAVAATAAAEAATSSSSSSSSRPGNITPCRLSKVIVSSLADLVPLCLLLSPLPLLIPNRLGTYDMHTQSQSITINRNGNKQTSKQTTTHKIPNVWCIVSQTRVRPHI
jgi:hypothetical protein